MIYRIRIHPVQVTNLRALCGSMGIHPLFNAFVEPSPVIQTNASLLSAIAEVPDPLFEFDLYISRDRNPKSLSSDEAKALSFYGELREFDPSAQTRKE